MRIGVLTAGGDCPGLNAAVRAVARSSIENGDEARGIRPGYRGLAEGDYTPLDVRGPEVVAFPLEKGTHVKRVDLGVLEIAKRFLS